MGLNVYVFRWSLGDCSANGISSPGRAKTGQLCLVNVEGPNEPSDAVPAAMLVHNNVFGDHRPLVKVVPATPDLTLGWVPETRWTMHGGNLASTSDSRFNQAVAKLLGVECWSGAVNIHDRIED